MQHSFGPATQSKNGDETSFENSHLMKAGHFDVFVFHLDSFSVVTACTILPTNQSVVLYPLRYRAGEMLAQ